MCCRCFLSFFIAELSPQSMFQGEGVVGQALNKVLVPDAEPFQLLEVAI
jgi:hypothetical protein